MRMEVLLIPALGLALTWIGYGPLSHKRNPEAGFGLAIAGFLFRIAGPLLLVWAAMLGLFAMSMAGWI